MQQSNRAVSLSSIVEEEHVYLPLGTGLAQLGLPCLAIRVADGQPPSAQTGKAQCRFIAGSTGVSEFFSLSPDCRCFAEPAEMPDFRPEMNHWSDGLYRAAIIHGRNQFDPHLELEDLGELWNGPLCLTHDEGCAFLAEAAGRDGRLQAWGAYVAEEYRRVEWARDALAAGDWRSFCDAVDESTRHLCAALRVTAIPAAGTSARWLHPGPTPLWFRISSHGAKPDASGAWQWLPW